MSQKNKLQELAVKSVIQNKNTTINIFRTAYKIVKKNQSLRF